jgi:hypothetical protein
MSMPVAAVHEKSHAALRKREIRPTGQVSAMEDVSEALGVQEETNDHFRHRALLADPSHVRASGLLGEGISHREGGGLVHSLCRYADSYSEALTTRATNKGASSKGAPPADTTPELVRIAVLVTKEERQRLKIVAAERGTTISDVVREGFARFLQSRSR